MQEGALVMWNAHYTCCHYMQLGLDSRTEVYRSAGSFAGEIPVCKLR